MQISRLLKQRSLVLKVSLAASVVVGVALTATAAQAQAVTLVSQILRSDDMQIALILFPFAVLMFGIIGEVIRLSLKGYRLTDPKPEPRQLRWAPGRGEG